MFKQFFAQRRYRAKLLEEALKIVEEKERRRKAYEALVGTDLNYPIIRDLVNSALHNTVVEVVLKDQSRIIIRRQEDFDKLQEIMSEERRISY